MARAIVIKDGRVLLHNRKKGEIIDNISMNDIYRYREFVKLYDSQIADNYPLSAGDGDTVEKQVTVGTNNNSSPQEPQTTDEKTVKKKTT
jgi:hypothetical protein